MTRGQYRRAMAKLCGHGLLTCTRGRPGDDDATYALAWLPLDDPERYPEEVRKLHARNMARLAEECARSPEQLA